MDETTVTLLVQKTITHKCLEEDDGTKDYVQKLMNLVKQLEKMGFSVTVESEER
jgi:hypothetical protein